MPGARAEIRVAVHADLDQTVGFKYAGVGTDPVRGEREVLHAGLAEVHLGVRRPGRGSAELATAAGGAYELGGRDFTHGVPLSRTRTRDQRLIASCRERWTAAVPA